MITNESCGITQIGGEVQPFTLDKAKAGWHPGATVYEGLQLTLYKWHSGIYRERLWKFVSVGASEKRYPVDCQRVPNLRGSWSRGVITRRSRSTAADGPA